MKLIRKPFLYLTSIFFVLMAVLLGFQYVRERSFKEAQLNRQLDTYNQIIYNFSQQQPTEEQWTEFLKILPDKALRITIVQPDGTVLFDSMVKNLANMENHASRPEITKAAKRGTGQVTRKSASVGEDYYYVAHRFQNMYIRTALPYNITLHKALRVHTWFLWLMAALFIVAIVLVYCVSVHFAKQLQQQELHMRQELTQNISHELKTPVASILGYMESLKSNPDLPAEKQHFFIERSYQQALRLSALLQDVNVLNRLNNKANGYSKNDNDLVKVVETVVHDVHLSLEQHHCTIQVDLPATMPLQGNWNLLYSIFRNLIDNTLAYAGEGVHIRITMLCADDKKYNLLYSDNGVGVPGNALPRLFERFYRLDKGRSRKLGGTGLGLSIVKNAVCFHGGTITANVPTSGGLDFLFSLNKK